MKKTKVYPTSSSPLLNDIYTYEEAVELFGEPEDYDFYVDLDSEIVSDYIKAKKHFYEMEIKLTNELKKSGVRVL